MENDTGTWVKEQAGVDTLHIRTVRLEVIAGPDRGLIKTFNTPTIVIGRANADLMLDDRRVSTMHAEIRMETAGFRLRDLGSRNGTHVGGLRVVEGFLAPSTQITVGDTTIRFESLADSVELSVSAADRLEGFVHPTRRRFTGANGATRL